MNKKKTILLGSLGLIPFYGNTFLLIFFPKLYYLNFDFFRQISIVYASLIVSFLSGMHWVKIINQKKDNIYILPMLPVIIAWSNQFLSLKLLNEIIVILLLMWCLIVDLKLFYKKKNFWYRKLRVYLTLLAIVSFFPQVFYQYYQWLRDF